MSFQNAGNVSTWGVEAGGSGIGGQLGLYMTLFQTTKMVLSECQRSTALEKDLGPVSTTQTCLYHLLLLWTFSYSCCIQTQANTQVKIILCQEVVVYAINLTTREAKTVVL